MWKVTAPHLNLAFSYKTRIFQIEKNPSAVCRNWNCCCQYVQHAVPKDNKAYCRDVEDCIQL